MGPLGHSAAALSALVAAPLFGAALLLRPAWRAGLRERLGQTSCEGEASLWIHAASLGETRAALRLARSFVAGGERIYLSHTRADALSIPFELRGGLAGRGVAPVDHPWCAARALESVAPRAVLLVETELWPVGIRAAAERGIAVGVVSACLSDRSFQRYWRFARWLRPTFGRLSFVAAQTELDAQRFIALGTAADRVAVTGDLKRDVPCDAVLAEDAVFPNELRACVAGRPLFVAGSTHEGEEAAVFEAYLRLRKQLPDALCLVAPRRIERSAEVAALAREMGLAARLRSEGDAAPLGPGEILVLDTLGELAACYALASVAFVGGSLVRVGGHNLYEAAHAGALVLHGPHVATAAEAARHLAGLGFAQSVGSAAELGDRVCEALGSAAEARLPRERVAAARARLLETPQGGDVAERTRAFVAQRLAAHARGVAHP